MIVIYDPSMIVIYDLSSDKHSLAVDRTSSFMIVLTFIDGTT